MDQIENAGRATEARDGYGRTRMRLRTCRVQRAMRYVIEEQGEPMALFVAEAL